MWSFCYIFLYPSMQKETNMAVMSRMTCKIGLIWRHMKTLYCFSRDDCFLSKLIFALSYSIIRRFEINNMFKFNEMLFYEIIENLNCQGCRIRQPIDKKHWQTEVLYCVFWSILSQIRHVCCRIFQKKKKVPKFDCSMVKFLCQLYWIGFRILQVKLCILGSHIF